MSKTPGIIFVFILFFLMSACSSDISPTSQPTATAAGKGPSAIAPNPGTTTVKGRLVSATSGKPFSNEYVALAEVHRNEQGVAAFGLNTRSSPQTSSDENGNFIFKDIPAGEYVVVVGDPMTKSMVLNDLTTGNAKVWNPQADQVLEIGELKFEFNTK